MLPMKLLTRILAAFVSEEADAEAKDVAEHCRMSSEILLLMMEC